MLKINSRKILISLAILCVAFLVVFLWFGYGAQKELTTIYNKQKSVLISDRKGREMCLRLNDKGYYNRYSDNIPARAAELLIKKEDRYFYRHPGVNPVSMAQAFFGRLGIGERKASSTITQQLAKILLGQEADRTIKNKTVESFYALALDAYKGKEEILKMYLDSVYFGNKAQGIREASRLYFGADPEMLTDGKIIQLLATLASPNENNPASESNKKVASMLAKTLRLNSDDLVFTEAKIVKENMRGVMHSDASCFEFASFPNAFSQSAEITIDAELAKKVRKIANDNVTELRAKGATNAAALVIKLPENEILAEIGSPDPESLSDGYKINMLTEFRAIGSTIKPFIYLNAFKKNLRPYTLVDDKEYKYITAIGFPLYPKNFDWKYRGIVTLHYALSNSLNVPAVKVLEYVGLDNFYNFLEKDLRFEPIQPLENYQLGIALGSLEMSLDDLAKYFTLFPNNGILKELKIDRNGQDAPALKISEPQYAALVNKILNDRKTGIEQFGLKSDFNLFQNNYALKTGTSRDYRDSWVIGYTPDFLVGVWVGNADASPTREVSGQAGAGRIWAETMDLLLNSEYNKKTPFDFSLIKEFNKDGNIEYGLIDDNYETQKNILIGKDASLIISPHNGDVFLWEKNTEIIFQAKESVKWFVNDKFLEMGDKYIFAPDKAGQYSIKAETSGGVTETAAVFVNE